MIKKILAVIFSAVGITGNAFANDDLVASTFMCAAHTYTFFPDNKYTDVLHIGSLIKKIPTIDYYYDGEQLKLRYFDVDGDKRESIFKATYLAKKGKLILTKGDDQEICTER